MDADGRFTARGARRGRACTCSTPTRTSSAHLKERRPRACATRPTTTPTRTAGAAPSRSSTGRSRRGSSQVTDVPRPHGRAQPADHLGARARQGRQLRQVAGRTPATGRSAATASGARRSRCGRATTPRYPRVDVYGSLAELERDFGVAGHRPAPPVRRRAGPPQPRRPDRAVDDAARPRGARLLVRVRLDAVRPGALPVRERRVVRAPLPGRLHRRVHRPDPRLVLHAARAGHGAVRPAGVPHVRQPRHRARRRRPEDVEEPAQLPRPDRGVRHVRRRRDALVPAVVADPARRRPRRDRAGHPRHRPPGAAAAVERVVLLHALRQRRGRARASCARRDRPTDVLDRYLLAKTARPGGRR